MFISVNHYSNPTDCDNCRRAHRKLFDIFTGKKSQELCPDCLTELLRLLKKEIK